VATFLVTTVSSLGLLGSFRVLGRVAGSRCDSLSRRAVFSYSRNLSNGVAALSTILLACLCDDIVGVLNKTAWLILAPFSAPVTSPGLFASPVALVFLADFLVKRTVSVFGR
jgi:hypothetical protein